jgi:hypothetical protein
MIFRGVGQPPTTTNHQPGTGAGHQATRGDPDPKAALPTTLLSPSAATRSGGGDNGGYLGDVTTNVGKTRSYSSHDMTGNCRNSTSNNGIVLPTKNGGLSMVGASLWSNRDDLYGVFLV